MIEALSNAWVQLAMWSFAAGIVFYFNRFIKGAHGAWGIIAVGLLLIGIRIGYKLLPFYQANQVMEATRYVIGIIGIVCLFLGLTKYCTEILAPLYRR